MVWDFSRVVRPCDVFRITQDNGSFDAIDGASRKILKCHLRGMQEGLAKSSREPRCTSAPAAGKPCGSSIRASEADHLMTGIDELLNDGAADEARRSGNKNSRIKFPP